MSAFCPRGKNSSTAHQLNILIIKHNRVDSSPPTLCYHVMNFLVEINGIFSMLQNTQLCILTASYGERS